MSDHHLMSAPGASPERESPGALLGSLDKHELGADGARRRLSVALAARNSGRPEGCCGLTFTSHAKRIICPLCGRTASAS